MERNLQYLHQAKGVYLAGYPCRYPENYRLYREYVKDTAAPLITPMPVRRVEVLCLCGVPEVVCFKGDPDALEAMGDRKGQEGWRNVCKPAEEEYEDEEGVRTFLMRWNPAISSFKLEEYRRCVHTYEWGFSADWSIWDWQKARMGDKFFMLREGDGVNPGIIYRGEFTSDPYEGDDWAGSDRKRYYVDMDCWGAVDPDEVPAIPTAVLDAAIPDINWHKGHSGELLPRAVAEALERLWLRHAPRPDDPWAL
ncbi:MAG: hypothetical protein K2H21_10685 [Muribaculaceae bacterium]|nr:hypothetical protein [Muribaculaceae bacterium]